MRTTETDGRTHPSGADDRSPNLMRPCEAATLANVCGKTLRRRAAAGLLTIIETLGGHARYYEHEIRALFTTTARTAQAAA